MENKELSLEDKVKPYLILAKVAEKQGNEELTKLLLIQMLKLVKFKDINMYSAKLEGFPQEFFIDYEEDSKVKSIQISELINNLKIESLSEIKKNLEKSENQYNGK